LRPHRDRGAFNYHRKGPRFATVLPNTPRAVTGRRSWTIWSKKREGPSMTRSATSPAALERMTARAPSIVAAARIHGASGKRTTRPAIRTTARLATTLASSGGNGSRNITLRFVAGMDATEKFQEVAVSMRWFRHPCGSPRSPTRNKAPTFSRPHQCLESGAQQCGSRNRVVGELRIQPIRAVESK
jgi:hypothetical protein